MLTVVEIEVCAKVENVGKDSLLFYVSRHIYILIKLSLSLYIYSVIKRPGSDL
jgi:hypothetical protein